MQECWVVHWQRSMWLCLALLLSLLVARVNSRADSSPHSAQSDIAHTALRTPRVKGPVVVRVPQRRASFKLVFYRIKT